MLVAVLLALSACTIQLPGATPSRSAGSSSPGLQADLIAQVTPATVKPHLQALQKIADDHGGNRATGSPGYAASVEYVKTTLTKAGYQVKVQQFSVVEENTEIQKASVTQGRPVTLSPWAFKGSGSTSAAGITAPLVAAEFSGCRASDLKDAKGKIVLSARGDCSFSDKVTAADQVGAAGLVIFDDDPSSRALRGALPDGLTKLPVVGITQQQGKELGAALDQAAVTLNLQVVIARNTVSSQNVLAELPGQGTAPVLMVGAHLDSVAEGPGLNDNGSGVSLVLALATALAQNQAAANVRFGFWGAEELGLLGSFHYVETLDPAQRQQITGYLNFDMVSSPNGVLGSYGTGKLLDTMTAAVKASGGTTTPSDIGEASDHAPFQRADIPVAGLFTGAGSPKTQQDAATFGGTVGEPYDPCYHQACDDLANTQHPEAITHLAVIAQAAVRAVLAARP